MPFSLLLSLFFLQTQTKPQHTPQIRPKHNTTQLKVSNQPFFPKKQNTPLGIYVKTKENK